MEPGKFLYLTKTDIENCGVTIKDALNIAEKTYVAHANGEYQCPPKPAIHPTNCKGAFLHAMPGYLPELEIAGMKWVSVYGHNKKKYNIPSLSSLIILNDVETGYPIAVMEASLITAIRTATASGVSAKYLARKDSEILAIVGAGEQGSNNLEVLCFALPSLDTVKIYDLYSEYAAKLAETMAKKLNVKIEICNSAKEAITDSDIIVTAAPVGSGEAVYKKEWLKNGSLILPVHSKGWESDIVKKATKFVVDDWPQYKANLFGQGNYFGDTKIEPYAELGEIVAGKKPGREEKDNIIYNGNYGIALQDISLGKEVLRIALEKNLGQELSLM